MFWGADAGAKEETKAVFIPEFSQKFCAQSTYKKMLYVQFLLAK